MAGATRGPSGVLSWLEGQQGKILPMAILFSVVIVAVPLPAALMDFLLALNIALSVAILLTTISLETPLQFSVFPTILLSTTLLRLVLNLATTRLILTNAATDGTQAAGHVIETFANFVAGGNLAVGIILFLILFVIQFAVITKGATRISEVAARFALDAMPGKQMAIDADLSANLIDQAEASRRREEITRQADFHASMDGASKFVRGDNVASIAITAVNILGGIAVGVFWYQMDAAAAARIFSLLTIGDGLVSQIPALLTAMAAGILVTRQSSAVDLGREFNRQLLFANPEVLYLTGGFMGAAAFSGLVGTGLPFVPLALLATMAGAGGYFVARKKTAVTAKNPADPRSSSTAGPAGSAPTTRAGDRPEDALKLSPITLEIGYGLLSIADRARGGDLDDRILAIRRQLASDLGFITPGVRLRDERNLKDQEYCIRIKGNVVARGEARSRGYLAIDNGFSVGSLQGVETVDPLYGKRAWWIDESQRDEAELQDFTVVGTSELIAIHLSDTIRRHAWELLNRERTSALVNIVKEHNGKVVEELIPQILKVGEIQKILQNLLREQVSIRDLETILETLGDHAGRVKDPDLLTEYVRHRLSRSICDQYRDENSVLHAVAFDPALEDMIAAGLDPGDRSSVKLAPAIVEGINRAIADEVRKLSDAGRPPVVLVGSGIRAAVKQMTSTQLPTLAVLSYNEISRTTAVESMGFVSYQPGQRPALAGLRAGS
jgi:flagellar biosynthesis protein FlhA